MKKFPNIANFVRDCRENENISQSKLSEALGYSSSGQFISNVERGICSIPVKKYKKLCKALNIFPQELEAALIADAEFEIKRNLYPERLQQLRKEYEQWDSEGTNSSSRKAN